MVKRNQNSQPIKEAHVKAGTSSSCKMNLARAIEVTKERAGGPRAN
jgi:hypothetical protein